MGAGQVAVEHPAMEIGEMVEPKGQRSVSPPPIQRELADRIGSRREVVSRELNSLERQGIIEKTRGAIILANVGELQRRVSVGWEQ